MTPDRAPWRLFVAAYRPPKIALAYLDAAAALDLPPGQATPPDQVHLTLHFIGPLPPREVERVVESVALATSGIGPCTASPLRLRTLPDRGDPRLVALELAPSPPIAELHARLARRLARPSKGTKAYLPHLTLFRFQPGTRGPSLDQGVNLPGFSVDRIRLMRSVLHVSGAEHREVGAWPLEGGRGGQVAE